MYSRFSPVMWAKLKIVSIQWKKSRIWDTIDDWYINNLTKNQVSTVSPKVIELCMEMPCLRPSEGHKHGGREATETSFCHWVLLLKRKVIAPEIRHIEINASLSASTVQLAKTKAITLLFTSATAFSGCHFHVTQCKSLQIQTCFITIRRNLSS